MRSGRRRDRHGRGVRGAVVPRTAQVARRLVELPSWRTRGERFESLVVDAARPLLQRWAAELPDLDLAVEPVPPQHEPADDGVVTDETPSGPVPLARVAASAPGHPAQLVVYRRPVELRAEDVADLRLLVREVVVEALAELLGMDPDEVDPEGQG